MTVSVKKRGLNLPQTITRKAGINPGDVVELTVRRGRITIRAAGHMDESRFPLYTPTTAETAAIRKGRAAYNRGDFVTLEQLRNELDPARGGPRKKVTRKAS